MTENSSLSSSISELIARAREDPELLGELLQRYRPLLMLTLRQRIGPKLAIRCSASDVLQQTFVNACRGFEQFVGATEPEFSAWIRQITNRSLKDALRDHVHVQGRSLEKEQHLYDGDTTASFCWREPAADQSTPIQKIIRGENALHLAKIVESLPEMQREAVRLRHLEGCSLKEIAERLDRTLPAAAGLVKRGVETLREKMAGSSWT